MHQAQQHQPTAIGWYFLAFKKYFVIRGRSTRSEYWFFFLFNLIAGIVLNLLDQVFGLYNVEEEMGILGSLYALIALIPGITVTVRRLHDSGRSGWWLLSLVLSMVALIVSMVMGVIESEYGEPSDALYVFIGVSILLTLILLVTIFIFTLLDSQRGSNRFGPNPKEVAWDDDDNDLDGGYHNKKQQDNRGTGVLRS